MLIGSSLDELLEESVLVEEFVEEELLEELELEGGFVEELFVIEEVVEVFEEIEACSELTIELLGATFTNWQPTSNIVTKGAINIFFIQFPH
jgi:hypothetical protein